jgi:hypothetical protein
VESGRLCPRVAYCDGGLELLFRLGAYAQRQQRWWQLYAPAFNQFGIQAETADPSPRGLAEKTKGNSRCTTNCKM